MPRRPARQTQEDISRAIRAAKENDAAGIMIDVDGRIHILLGQNTLPIQPDSEGQGPEWTMSQASGKPS